MDKEFLNIEDIMGILGISKSSAYRLLYKHGLKHVKVGQLVLVRRSDLEEYLEKHTRGGEEE